MSCIPPAGPDQSLAINDIVDRLKKQGLFDRFRKECLADVDTKPAYQNLRHRVENAVASFLSTQKWRQDLNKNQLRESLRRHITESQMLATGVDRVVEQVVNPKISQVFKADVDQAICDYMGIDREVWEAKLRKRDELRQQIQQLEQQQKQREQMGNNAHGQIPNLMEMDPVHDPSNQPHGSHGNMPPPGDINSALLAISNTVPGMNAGNVMGPPGQMGPPAGVPDHPGGAGFPGPGVAPHTSFNNFPAQPGTSAFPGGFPPPFPNFNPAMPGMTNFWPGMANMNMAGLPGMPAMDPSQMGVAPPIPGQDAAETSTKESKKPKKKIEPVTVESFLNIPLPKSEPPKPRKKAAEKEIEEKLVEDDSKQDAVVCEEAEFTSEQMQVEGVVLDGEIPQPTDDKVYHFAWDDVAGGAQSDVTVSSVHTSDLSEFDDDDVEEAEDSGGAVDSQNSADEAETEGAEDLKESADDTVESGTPIQSPVKEAPVTPQRAKPKKLISLSYNYSDSDDDETREERKARIALEKEERYLRRQQRRAELEAKRKEREEERARNLGTPRKQRPGAQGQTDTTDTPTESEQAETPARPSKDLEPSVPSNDTGEAEAVPLEPHTEAQPDDLAPDDAVNKSLEVAEANKPETDVTSKDDEKAEEVVTETAEVLEVTQDQASILDKATLSPSEDSPKKPSTPLSSPQKKHGSPRKRTRISKEEAKEILREQKVMEKRMALRRQRTKNRRYMSEDFTSIFTERKNLLSGVGDGYVEEEVVVEQAVEIESQLAESSVEVITIDLTEGIQASPPQEDTEANDQQAISMVTSPSPPAEQTSRSKRRRPPSPYSDISESDSDSSTSTRGRESRGRDSPAPRHTRSQSRRHQPSSPHSPRGADGERYQGQRYDSSDLYKPRTSFGSRRRGNRSPYPEGEHDSSLPGSITKARGWSPPRSRSPHPRSRSPVSRSRRRPRSPGSDDQDEDSRNVRQHRDNDTESAYEPITTPEQDEFDDPKSDDERSSESSLPSRTGSSMRRRSRRHHSRSTISSRSRSRSQPRSRSLSRSLSRSRSRSRSRSSKSRSRSRSSRSRSRSDTRSTRSTSRSKSARDSDSERDTDSEERIRRSKVSVDKISFGEAAKRASRNFIEDVDFGEAARHTRGGPGGYRGYPGQGYPSFRGPRGRGMMMAGPPPLRGAPIPRGIPPGVFPMRGGLKRGMPPVRGGATSPRGTSPFRSGPPFPPYTRSKFGGSESGDFSTSPSPEKRRLWPRGQSSDSEGVPPEGFTRSLSHEDSRSRSSGNLSPTSEDYPRGWEEEGEEEPWRPSPPRMRGRPRRLPPHSRGSPEMEEGEMRTPSDDEVDDDEDEQPGPSSPHGQPHMRRRVLSHSEPGPPPLEAHLRGPPPHPGEPWPRRPLEHPAMAGSKRRAPYNPEITEPTLASPDERMTRASRKRSEEENAPIAKRLRQH